MVKLKKEAVSHGILTKALKSDNYFEAQKALVSFISMCPKYSTPMQELGMTPSEFREFAEAIRTGDLNAARRMFGVELDFDTGDKWRFQKSSKNPITYKSPNGTNYIRFPEAFDLDGSKKDVMVEDPYGYWRDEDLSLEGNSGDLKYLFDEEIERMKKMWPKGKPVYDWVDTMKAKNMFNAANYNDISGKLVSLANKLDKLGYYELADRCDKISKILK